MKSFTSARRYPPTGVVGPVADPLNRLRKPTSRRLIHLLTTD